MEPADQGIIQAAREAFAADAALRPAISLRGGEALDGYGEPPVFDATLDEPVDAYLEAYTFNGLIYLDPASWRHYLPRLIDYCMRHLTDAPGMVAEGLLWSLRPPDRDPPRLRSLSSDQEAVLVAFLERVAFGEEMAAERDLALQVLEEWWIPGALCRTGENDP